MTYYLHKVYFSRKIPSFVKAKSDEDPHWFGSLDLDPHPHCGKKLDPDPH
jgi:hypothetical protein